MNKIELRILFMEAVDYLQHNYGDRNLSNFPEERIARALDSDDSESVMRASEWLHRLDVLKHIRRTVDRMLDILKLEGLVLEEREYRI